MYRELGRPCEKGDVESLGLSVDIKDHGAVQGALTSDHKIYLNITAGRKTLVHEISHYLADHLATDKPHKQRELEAEATAYVVCRHFGYEDLKSPNYLYLSGLISNDLRASLFSISKLTQEIISLRRRESAWKEKRIIRNS